MVEMSLAALMLTRTTNETNAELFHHLALSETALKATCEMLTTWSQHFKDITKHGVEMARKMLFVVEQGIDAVLSDTHRSSTNILTAKIEIEAAKSLEIARLYTSGKKWKKKGRG